MKFEANYSISDLEKLSGIKAHTLRIWEKRYALFEPDRTDTNIRYYSNQDLVKILNVSLLNKHGYKISVIAAMDESEIAAKVSSINLIRTENDDLIDNFIISMIEMNEPVFDKSFSSCIMKMGFEATIQKVIFPFLNRIGVMWQTGSINPAQEHFISNLIRQKMIAATESIGQQVSNKKQQTVVLFLPENELHELSLLFYNYMLKARGFKTIYLGQSVPIANLNRIAEVVKPDFMVCVITNSFSDKELSRLIQMMKSVKGVKRTFVSGNGSPVLKKNSSDGNFFFQNGEELISRITK